MFGLKSGLEIVGMVLISIDLVKQRTFNSTVDFVGVSL